MPIDFNDPPTLKYMSEYFERETKKRLAWFRANQEEIEDSSHKPFKHNYRKSDIRRVKILNNLHVLVNQHHASYSNRRKKVPRDGPILGFSDYKPDQSLVHVPVMKPVEDNVRHLLTFDLPNGGRRKYLKERIRKKPEDRYSFCETSNGIYGWGLKIKLTGEARFGNKYTFHRGVQSRSGPQPDPIYYTEITPKRSAVFNPFDSDEEISCAQQQTASTASTSAAKVKTVKAKQRRTKKAAELHGCDSDLDSVANASAAQPKKRRVAVFLDSEGDEEEPIRAAPLRNFLTRRTGSGYTLQRDPSRRGEYYVELRVFTTRELEPVATEATRWKHAFFTYKGAVNNNSPVFKAVRQVAQAAKEEYKGVQPVLYPSNTF